MHLTVVCKRMLKILSGGFADGMALFPFIILSTKELKLT